MHNIQGIGDINDSELELWEGESGIVCVNMCMCVSVRQRRPDRGLI